MTSLTNLAHDLEVKVQRLDDLRKAQLAEEHLAARARETAGALAAIQAVAAFTSAASAAGITPEGRYPGGAAVREARAGAEAALGVFRADRSALDQSMSARLTRQLNSAMRELESAARSTWREHVATTLPPPIGPLVDVFRADPRARGSLDELLRVDGRLRGIGQLPFPSAPELGEYQRLTAERDAIWSSMPLESDEEVVAFIRAAGQDGAPLRLLTPKVRAWLTDQNLLDKYVVRSRS